MKKAYFTFIFSLLFLVCSESDYSENVTNHYVSNIADLNQFATEILKYEKINSMSFGAHFIQTLNGSKISLGSVTSDTSNFKFVLEKYQVNDSTYLSFYDRLGKLRFIRFEYKQNTIIIKLKIF